MKAQIVHLYISQSDLLRCFYHYEDYLYMGEYILFWYFVRKWPESYLRLWLSRLDYLQSEAVVPQTSEYVPR